MNINRRTSHLILVILVTIPFIMTSCFSTYPIQKKFPCSETTTSQKLDLIRTAFISTMNPKNLDVNEEGVTYNKNSFKFSDVRYVRVQQKSGLTGKKYWIDIKEFNGDGNTIYLRDYNLVEKANNALMCLTNLQDTNGRPKDSNTAKPDTPTSNKYEDLEKLKKLLDSGAITQEEYEKEKAIILNKKN